MFFSKGDRWIIQVYSILKWTINTQLFFFSFFFFIFFPHIFFIFINIFITFI